jgi:hypothetical protein
MADTDIYTHVAPRTAKVPTYKMSEKTGKNAKGPKETAEVSMLENDSFCKIQVNVLPKGKQAAGDAPMVSDTVTLSGKDAAPFLKALQVGPEECKDKAILLTTSRPDTTKKAPPSNLPVFHE